MLPIFRSWLVFALCGGFASLPSHADIIAGDFTGWVTSSYSDTLGTDFANGQQLTGTFWYDTAAGQLADSRPSDREGVYEDQGSDDAWVHFNWQLNGQNYSLRQQNPVLMDLLMVTNDIDRSNGRDSLVLLERRFSDVMGANGELAQLVVQDWIDELVNDDALIQQFNWQDATQQCHFNTPWSSNYERCGFFSVQEWDAGVMTHQVNAWLTEVNFNIPQGVVPGPGSLGLMLLGLFGLARCQRV